jgi:hypothetical protein
MSECFDEASAPEPHDPKRRVKNWIQIVHRQRNLPPLKWQPLSNVRVRIRPSPVYAFLGLLPQVCVTGKPVKAAANG